MSMTPTLNESLSAWMDGELRDDEGRFVAKRLMHDTQLQSQLARWTDIGDSLREVASRENADVAPSGFLDRVRVAIDQERANIHAPDASEIAIARAAASESRMSRLKSLALKPSAIAASLTLLAAAVLLQRVGSPLNDELLTSLTMQNVTQPSTLKPVAKKTVRPTARTRPATTRVAARTPAPRVQRVNTQIATAQQAAVKVRQANTVASAPTTVQSLPPRMSSTFTNVRPNVVASSSDPFGLGSAANNRVLSGAPSRAWPKARIGTSPRTMNASFNGGTSGSANANDPFAPNGNWPMQMSLSAQGVN